MSQNPSDQATLQAKTLADWHEAIQDRGRLLESPDAYTGSLIDLAKQAKQQGVISDDDLRELVELAGAAQEWAEEELLSRVGAVEPGPFGRWY